MTKTFVVRYQTKSPEAADANQALVQKVFAQLRSEDPAVLRYATFRLEDGLTFVHVAIHDHDERALVGLSAFQDFQRGIGDRVTGAPVVAEATMIGSYRFTP
ncbi:hypothetical protein [Nocardia asiatica]|uniref:hypothetical protein n=1 Tax=Nocardia asiatica TaxID=209252 RepID=UPI003EE17CA7